MAMDLQLAGVIAIKPPLYITLLFVDKQYHRRGIARKLFETVINDETITSGHDRITVHSSPYAVNIYRRMGFEPTDTEQIINELRFTPMELVLQGDGTTGQPEIIEMLELEGLRK